MPYLTLLEIGIAESAHAPVVETIYVTNSDESVEWNGNTYVRYPFEVELKQEAKEMPELTLSMQDVSGLLHARVTQYRGAVGFRVRVIGMNADTMDEPEIQEDFFVLSSNQNDFTVSFQIGTAQSTMSAFPPRRQFRDVCAWRYKGDECGYSGEMPTCSRSYNGTNGCIAHNNGRRYGGFPTFNTQ